MSVSSQQDPHLCLRLLYEAVTDLELTVLADMVLKDVKE